MTAQQKQPHSLTAATCPLLAAVIPLRYAIGPTLGVDISAYNLPPLQGSFPELGPEFPPVSTRPLNYTARLLRDGWLYVWQGGQSKLLEYQVTNANLAQTPRAGRVLDTRRLPYLLLRAGEQAMLAWSPSPWSDTQFSASKASAKVRQRIMRSITPGAAPHSGNALRIHERIGDYMDAEHYTWSCQPNTRHRPNWIGLLGNMQRCEQQTYALLDDPWGVLLDLAALLRARQRAFDQLRQQRSDDWAMAGVIESLAKSDKQIKQQLPAITRYSHLSKTLKEQHQEEDSYADDIRRISQLWADWLNTLANKGPASLDTACGHFDITQPQARAELEYHFAAACLGPSGTSIGAKALSHTLTPEQQTGSPWLLWALLGVSKRLGIGDIKSLVDISDSLNDNLPALSKEAASLGRAMALSTLLNRAADNLSKHNPATATDALLTALAPVAGLHLRDARKAAVESAGRLYLAAALARGQQRLAVAQASPRQVGEWLSAQLGTQPKPPPSQFKRAPIPKAINAALPFFYLQSVAQSSKPSGKLAPLSGALAAELNLKDMLNLSKDALEKAPIKCLVALVAGVNLGWSAKQLIDEQSLPKLLSLGGGTFGLASTGAAVIQKVAETNWELTAKATGNISLSSQVALARALGAGATAASLQAVTSGLDVMIYGIEALEAYQAGDFDTATINASLSAASAVNLAIYVKTYRVIRAARAAVIAGDAAAISRGVAQAPHLVFKALGVTILIVGGVIARLYTQDTPLEKWVKGTRFGIAPAPWANDYKQAMTELYKILFPIHFDTHRLNELNPYRGQQTTTYLILRLPGQAALTDEMIHFKGEEIWGGIFGFGSLRKSVEWTGKDFDKHAGSRVNIDIGVATYRRVYHPDRNGRELNKINGKLSYSPLEGLILPPVDVEDIAWL